jgi:hypothetical protein
MVALVETGTVGKVEVTTKLSAAVVSVVAFAEAKLVTWEKEPLVKLVLHC